MLRIFINLQSNGSKICNKQNVLLSVIDNVIIILPIWRNYESICVKNSTDIVVVL